MKRAAFVFLIILYSFSLFSMPPHPSLWGKVKLPHLPEHEIHPRLELSFDPTTQALRILTSPKAPTSGSVKGVAILIDFDDKPHQVQPGFFDDLLNGLGIDWGTAYPGNTNEGSVREFYRWSSEGKLDLTFDVYGWYRAPHPYSYYVSGDYGLGRIAELVSNTVKAADPDVDFSRYDANGDGMVDFFLLIHAGSGAEYTGSNNDIRSHQGWANASTDEGVYVGKYITTPELWETPGDMTIGVYCHEIGHLFELPDLYDTDESSYGLGRWSLMSYGLWNGPAGMGGSPAGFDAWSKAFLGWMNPVPANDFGTFQVNPSEEGDGLVFFKHGDDSLKEYFLVEYRPRMEFDAFLPGEGVLIYHVDDDVSSNRHEWYPGLDPTEHYKVALEQSDGRWDLEHKTNLGDETDPWRAFTNFTPVSTPNSDYYLEPSGVCIRVETLGDFAVIKVSPYIGDFNEDGKIDAEDLALFSLRWGEDENSPGWDPVYDIGPRIGFSSNPFVVGELVLENPRRIDEKDLDILIQLFGMGVDTK